MDNYTRNSPKENTATYLLRKFIDSEKPRFFNLLPIDLLILRTICDYLDMPKSECYEKQDLLAEKCLIKRQYFSDRCSYMHSVGVLFRFFRWRRYNYQLGFEITGIDPYL